MSLANLSLNITVSLKIAFAIFNKISKIKKWKEKIFDTETGKYKKLNKVKFVEYFIISQVA